MKLNPKKVPPFAMVPSEVFLDKRLSLRAIRILGVCYSHANKNTYSCSLYMETFSGLTGIDIRDVKRTMAMLEGTGWFHRQYSPGRKSKSTFFVRPPRNKHLPGWDDDFYISHFGSGTDSNEDESPMIEEGMVGDLNVNGGSFESKAVGVSPTQYRFLSDNLEQNPARRASELSTPSMHVADADVTIPSQDESFRAFWEAYPKKKGRKEALDAWNSLKPNMQLFQRILVVLKKECQTDQWQKNGGDYIPYPAKWLRREPWDDECYVSESFKNPADLGEKPVPHASHKAYKRKEHAHIDNSSTEARKALAAMKLAVGRSMDGKMTISNAHPPAEEL